MRTPEEIRAERGYRRVDLTIAERDFLRSLVSEAKSAGNELATGRLLRVLDTTFEKFRRAAASPPRDFTPHEEAKADLRRLGEAT